MKNKNYFAQTIFGVNCMLFSTISVASTEIQEVKPNEDIITYLKRTTGAVEPKGFRQILGAASDYKEGDGSIGVHAANEESRSRPNRIGL